MKITVDIDCTPEEARQFLGLPDVKPLQDAMMENMMSRVDDMMSGQMGEEVMKSWMPGGVQGMDSWRNLFWSGAGMPSGKDGSDSKE